MARTTKTTINGTRGDDPNLDGSALSPSAQAGGLIINGNAGNDTIKGGSGADILNGDDGNDRIIGDLADVLGSGGAGKVVWDGGRGNDTLDLSAITSDAGKGLWVQFEFLSRGTNLIRTNADKNDYSMAWGSSFDATYTNNFTGFENVTMGDGNDIVTFGNGSGSNIVRGGGGNDYLAAGDGNDTIYGGDGDDMLVGGWGSDTQYGGVGNDMFLITGRVVGEYQNEVIKDFDIDSSDGTHDQIWLWPNWAIAWDENSPGVLHGFLMDGATVFGEVTLEGLTYADHASVEWHHVDPATGMPVG